MGGCLPFPLQCRHWWSQGTEKGSVGCLSVLHPEECNSEEVCVRRKISWRFLLMWLIIVIQRKKKKFSPWLCWQVVSIQQIFDDMLWVRGSAPFQTVMQNSCLGLFFLKMWDPGSIVLLWGLLCALNFHLHSNSFLGYILAEDYFQGGTKRDCEGLEIQWPARGEQNYCTDAQ